jgi:hypothetical protein
MWGALVRQFLAFVLTQRGKRVVAFIGVMLLCFATTLLLDLKLYLTAGFTGLLAGVALIAWLRAHWTVIANRRAREQRRVEHAIHRAQAKAQARKARAEKIDKARAAFSGAARSVHSRATGFAGAAKTRFSGLRENLKGRRPRPEPDDA